MAMMSEAFRNYLAEVTAMRIAEEVKIDGMLAAAIHSRHKVRRTDLEKFLERANASDAKSWERKFFTYCLVVYGVAAYANVQDIWTRDGKVDKVEVIPHWSESGSSYALDKVIFLEPLNLFPGLATENLSNNMIVIDQHRAAFYADGTSKSLAMMPHHSKASSTQNEKIAVHMQALSKHSQLSGANSMSTPIKPVVTHTVSGTPVSNALGKGKMGEHISQSVNIEEMTSEFDNSVGKKKKIESAKLIHEQVSKLHVDAVALGIAGVSHYENLMINYAAAMKDMSLSDDPLNVKKTLEGARDRWQKNRLVLQDLIGKFKQETHEDFPMK
ncbi:MAG: hypothetical protein CTR55_19995 [Pseudomonas sp.]|uniref:hypothetical protein n=1 Tax=Pseudomonas sp. TaxID=306 RepID=UPI000CBB31D3|nr:hypothetical protein [Pseudomonas sp.]PJI47462.1 MAG: hypothetical protein CTR55_19995 [Pseudomonas sp.]